MTLGDAKDRNHCTENRREEPSALRSGVPLSLLPRVPLSLPRDVASSMALAETNTPQSRANHVSGLSPITNSWISIRGITGFGYLLRKVTDRERVPPLRSGPSLAVCFSHVRGSR
jgi:hypothetical protein